MIRTTAEVINVLSSVASFIVSFADGSFLFLSPRLPFDYYLPNSFGYEISLLQAVREDDQKVFFYCDNLWDPLAYIGGILSTDFDYLSFPCMLD